MPKLPIIIATSVIRSAHQGDSHGGVYLVNLETDDIDQPIDWNDGSISWEGRGLDRGLRGISFHKNEVYIAASNEIFVYNSLFVLQRSIRNNYLKHCHEIFIHGGRLYLTSTGYDSVLEYNLEKECFTRGFHIRAAGNGKLTLGWFDPNSDGGPKAGDSVHLNNVYGDNDTLYIAALHLPFLVAVNDANPSQWGKIPVGSHNARPFKDGILLNDTAANRVLITDCEGIITKSFPIKMYEETALLNNDLPEDHARQGFARGLVLIDGGEYIVFGSSPSTISVYETKQCELVKEINLTMDVRNSIHGLELWPFSWPK